MFTRAQFVGSLTRDNPRIYLGGPSVFHTQSSMLPLVNAVHTYEGTANPANLLAVYLTIDNLPAGKKVRYSQAIADLQNSMAAVKVTANPFTLHAVPSAVFGIAVPRSNTSPGIQTDIIIALRQLEMLPTGRALIIAISNQFGATGKQVGVQKWDFQQTNKCQIAATMNNDADRAKTDLALAMELEFQQANAGGVIASCLTRLGHAPPAGYTWLQNQVNTCPIYRIVGLPSVIPSANVHGANWVSAAMLQAWGNGAAVFPQPLAGQRAEDAAVVLATILQGGATPGLGVHSTALWDKSSDRFTDTMGVVQAKLPYISLGHELIHAYHN